MIVGGRVGTGMSILRSNWVMVITPIEAGFTKSLKKVINQLAIDRYDHFHGHPSITWSHQ